MYVVWHLYWVHVYQMLRKSASKCAKQRRKQTDKMTNGRVETENSLTLGQLAKLSSPLYCSLGTKWLTIQSVPDNVFIVIGQGLYTPW